jgi:hypothetical protein
MFAIVIGLLRHLLTLGGGYLVKSGLVDSEQLTTGVGAVVAIVGIVWSVVAKLREKPAPAELPPAE